LDGEIQILAIGSFPLRPLRVQFRLPLYFLLFQRSKPILCPSLSALVVYLKSVSFHSFTHSREHYRFYETSSFSETKARSLIKEAGNEFVQHNAWQLSRVYPSGLRTDSSNYNPQELWNAGCQMGEGVAGTGKREWKGNTGGYLPRWQEGQGML